MFKRMFLGVALLLGLISLINGTLMIYGPETWYWMVPGVPDRGPFNQHFVRDIGITYVIIGSSYLFGVLYGRNRTILWLFPTIWLLGHAVFHMWEVYVGICSPDSLKEDFWGVTFPAFLGCLLTYLSMKEVTIE